MFWAAVACGNPPAPVQEILTKKCGICHLGPFLDLKNNYYWSDSSDPLVMATAFMQRIRKEGWGKMPPVTGDPLTCDELLILEGWANSLGIPAKP